MKTYKSFYLHEALDENPTGLGITVNFDDYTTGEAVSSQLELSNNDIVDNLYMYSNYQMLDRRGDDNAVTLLVRLWDRFIANHEHELSSMLSALYSKYNPLENYNKHGNVVDKHTGSDSVSGSSGNTKTLNTSNSVSGTVNVTDTFDTDNKTTYGSGSSSTIGTHTDTHTTPSVTTTHSEGSYDSNTLKSVSSDSTNQVQVSDVYGAQTNGITNTGHDTFEQNGTVEHETTNNTTTTDTGTITDNSTNSESTTYNSTNTIIDTTHGNIGVMTSQSMINEELALRKYSFIDYLMAYFVGTMCYYVDDVDWGDFR